MTLAAEIFRESPALKDAARRTDAFTRLEERVRRVQFDGDESYAVLEGDLLYDDDEFHLYALQQAQRVEGALVSPLTSAPLEPPPALTGISAGNRIVRWAPGRVLRYCVLRASFLNQSQYEQARDSVIAAANAWEGACGIEFEHLLQHDEHPTQHHALRYRP